MEGTTVTGMAAVIDAIVKALQPSVFFSLIADLMPFLTVMVPVALGLMFLRKMIKGAGKGKVKF